MAEYRLRIDLRGPLGLGSGGRLGPARAWLRPDGEPVLPARALKAALRLELGRVQRGLADPSPLGPRICAAGDPCRRVSERCLACCLFGGVEPGALRLGDGRIRERKLRLWLAHGGGRTTRVRAAVDRRSRAVTRTFPEQVLGTGLGLTFESRVESSRPLTAPEQQALRVAVAALGRIGPGSSRGLGLCDASLEVVTPSPVPTRVLPQSPNVLVLRSAGGSFGAGCGCAPGAVASPQACLKGRAARGALAAAFLERHGASGQVDPAFQRLFSGGELRIGWLWPGGRCPPPATLRQCAENPRGHGIWDLLVTALVASCRGTPLGGFAPRCPHCGAALERVDGWPEARPGFRRRVSLQPARRNESDTTDRAPRAGATSRTDDRPAYHEILETTSSGGLARVQREGSRAGVPAGSDPAPAGPAVFSGPVRIPLQDAPLVAELGRVHLGSGRSCGRGAFHLELRADEGPAVSRRMADLRACLHAEEEAWRQWLGERTGPSAADLVVLDLQSPVRLPPGPWPLPLETALRRYLPEAQVHAFWGDREALGGYNEAAGAPADLQTVLAAGSVIVLRPGAAGARFESLARLEADGFGLDRRDGLGFVRIADPIHAKLCWPSDREAPVPDKE